MSSSLSSLQHLFLFTPPKCLLKCPTHLLSPHCSASSVPDVFFLPLSFSFTCPNVFPVSEFLLVNLVNSSTSPLSVDLYFNKDLPQSMPRSFTRYSSKRSASTQHPARDPRHVGVTSGICFLEVLKYTQSARPSWRLVECAAPSAAEGEGTV